MIGPRVRTLLGRLELQVTASILFLIMATWPVWTHSRPSTALLSIFAVWIAFSVFSVAAMALGREPDDDVVGAVDDEEGPT